MMASRESDQTMRTRSSRYVGKWDVSAEGRGGERGREGTDDEGGVLLLVGGGEEEEGVDDLDAGIGVDLDRVLVGVAGRRRA